MGNDVHDRLAYALGHIAEIEKERDAAYQRGVAAGRAAERSEVLALTDCRVSMANMLVRFGGSGGGLLQGLRDEIADGLHIDGKWRTEADHG